MKVALAGDVALTHVDPDNFRHVGVVELLGVHFHVEMIRVEDGLYEMQSPPIEAPPEVHDLFDDMWAFYDGPYQTVEFPGLEGRFVMFIHPFAD